jgi:hypothetical protein
MVQWQGFYESMPDGRSKITGAALIALKLKDGLRVLDSLLKGWPTKILLLDKPLQLGEEVKGADIPEYYLRRIRVCDLPGWPPMFALSGDRLHYPPLKECRLVGARFERGNGPGKEGVEISLENKGETFTAWHLGCPVPLLKCVEATLNQDGAAGKKLGDLQEMRLIGVE